VDNLAGTLASIHQKFGGPTWACGNHPATFHVCNDRQSIVKH